VIEVSNLHTIRPSRIMAIVALLVLALAAPRPVSAQAAYVVEDLGVLPGDTGSVALAINAHGDVVGWSANSADTRAFVYTTAGGMVQLPSPSDRPRTVARDINDAGVVVGGANKGGTDLGHAVVWSNGTVEDLGTLATGFYSEAYGVNNLGQVVGYSYTDGGAGMGVHGFSRRPGEALLDITPDSDTGYASDVNDAGQVTGYKTALGGYHAFRWAGGTFTDLGVLPGFAHSFGSAINASGQVAGSSASASGNTERVFRSDSEATLTNLGGVGETNSAMGINASGSMVGVGRPTSGLKRAFLYTDAGGLQDLNTLIDPSSGWFILNATDINDAGQIVGYGTNDILGVSHAVRLRPATVPPGAAQMQLPVPGSTLPGSAATFTWTPVDGSSQYWLTVGTTAGGAQILDASQALRTSATVSKLPVDGKAVYVRLWTKRAGQAWKYLDYTYKAATVVRVSAKITSPAPGSVLPGATVTFAWDAGAGVSEYWLSVGTTTGGATLYDKSQALRRSVTVGGLPTNGRTVYVRLFSRFPGAGWKYNDVTYRAAAR
jgi:probable HAF family extracellular repeat protein